MASSTIGLLTKNSRLLTSLRSPAWSGPWETSFPFPILPSLTLLQPHWPSCCSNVQSLFPLQSLMHLLVCLPGKHFSLVFSHTVVSFRNLRKSHPLGSLWRLYNIKCCSTAEAFTLVLFLHGSSHWLALFYIHGIVSTARMLALSGQGFGLFCSLLHP